MNKVLFYVFLYKTKWGLRLIAVGEHPKAAETLDISVRKIRYLAVMFSGFMGGLGGASMSLAVVSVFSPTLIAGQGYIALVCVIFGLTQAIATYLTGTSIQLPMEFISMIPYISILIFLILFNKKSNAPKASGKPYLTEDI